MVLLKQAQQQRTCQIVGSQEIGDDFVEDLVEGHVHVEFIVPLLGKNAIKICAKRGMFSCTFAFVLPANGGVE